MEDFIYQRIEAELQRRNRLHLHPSTWAALAREINVGRQRVGNWKARGVPPRMYPDVANALGWSIDHLIGKQDLQRPTERQQSPAATAPSAWRVEEPDPPGPSFADKHEVSDSDWHLLQDVKTAAYDEELAEIRKRAAWLGTRAQELANQHNDNAMAKAKSNDRGHLITSEDTASHLTAGKRKDGRS